MLIIGVDPGKVTGVATYQTWDKKFESFELPALEAMEAVCDKVESMLNSRGTVEIVCESFTINSFTAQHSRQYDALESIGVLKFLTHRHRGSSLNLEMRPPATRKVVSNEALQRLGWYNPSPDKHMIDASKHLATRCMQLGVLRPEFLRGDQGEI